MPRCTVPLTRKQTIILCKREIFSAILWSLTGVREKAKDENRTFMFKMSYTVRHKVEKYTVSWPKVIPKLLTPRCNWSRHNFHFMDTFRLQGAGSTKFLQEPVYFKQQKDFRNSTMKWIRKISNGRRWLKWKRNEIEEYNKVTEKYVEREEAETRILKRKRMNTE